MVVGAYPVQSDWLLPTSIDVFGVHSETGRAFIAEVATDCGQRIFLDGGIQRLYFFRE